MEVIVVDPRGPRSMCCARSWPLSVDRLGTGSRWVSVKRAEVYGDGGPRPDRAPCRAQLAIGRGRLPVGLIGTHLLGAKSIPTKQLKRILPTNYPTTRPVMEVDLC